jgi:hypothetical protein
MAYGDNWKLPLSESKKVPLTLFNHFPLLIFSPRNMKKAKISLAMLSGEVEALGARILIPFKTDKSQFSEGVAKKIPWRANLIFEGTLNGKGKIEYRFSGVDMRCWCDDCKPPKKKKKK